MATRAVTHLNFQGQARAALDFYHIVFGGQKVLVTYADAGRVQALQDSHCIIWGQVTGQDGIALMACDLPHGQDFHPGDHAFYVSLRGSDIASVRSYWDGLLDGAAVLQALAPSQRSPLYGMLRDRFGVTWVADVALDHATG